MNNGVEEVAARRSRLGLYAGVGLLWAILLSGALAAVVYNEWGLARRSFEDEVARVYEFVVDRTRDYESAVEGFASFVGGMSEFDFQSAREYVRQLRGRFSDIYMIELAYRVAGERRQAFEQEMRQAGNADFTIHFFSYDTDRKIVAAPPRPYYYPIVFVEPEPAQASAILGLDVVGSSNILEDAMARSFTSGTEVASLPFDLLEGRRGYVLYRPVAASPGSEPIESSMQQPVYALLVVDAAQLIPDWVHETPGLSARLYHRDAGSADARGRLAIAAGPQCSRTERELLPVLVSDRSLPGLSQPFDLILRRQLGWSDINPPVLAMLLVLSVIAFATTLWFGRSFHQRQLRLLGERDRFFSIANFDTLTGLPNRNLLNDRLAHALQRVKRQHGSLGLLFLDLDNFKAVNDRFGHSAGDAVLREAAVRLKRMLRDQDTVGRLYGDEFLVLIEDVVSDAHMTRIRDKITRAFESPFIVDGRPLQLGVSIGIAQYPRDGDLPETLLRQADLHMFQEKRTTRRRRAAPPDQTGAEEEGEAPAKA
jgi:diguanylate cyclase (GGDEF)-like protein